MPAMRIRHLALLATATVMASTAVFAQEASGPPRETIYAEGTKPSDRKNPIVAVPPLVTPRDADTEAGSTSQLGRQIAQVIVNDLARSSLYEPRGPQGLNGISYGEINQPNFSYWRGQNANFVIQGFVQRNDNGTLTVGCYLYDVELGRETARRGFMIPPRDWRRAAHKCSDTVYSKLSGESPFFDSRIAYIAETGPKGKRVKRLAIMDSDGANHEFITFGSAMALTPRWSPDYKKILYLSYQDNRPRIYIYDVASKSQKLVTQSNNQTFAPRWSPDGKWILYSMAVNGNTDIYRVSANGGTPVRLTDSAGIDVGGSYSPDGRRIVFESDRSGSQQLWVMNADGTNQHRISRGGGRYATPEWSPRGDLIAYTKIAGNFRIGIMTPEGEGEQLLTDSWQDEAPSWAPNGRVLQFFRTSQGAQGKSTIWQVDITGVNERRIETPEDGSDPAWGPVLQ